MGRFIGPVIELSDVEILLFLNRLGKSDNIVIRQRRFRLVRKFGWPEAQKKILG
jgi:hypothetical protein